MSPSAPHTGRWKFKAGRPERFVHEYTFTWQVAKNKNSTQKMEVHELYRTLCFVFVVFFVVMMSRLSVVIFAACVLCIAAQQPGKQKTNPHPKMTWQECTSATSCEAQPGEISIVVGATANDSGQGLTLAPI